MLDSKNIDLETKIPLPNITTRVLVKLVEWASHHAEVAGSKPEKSEISLWDQAFIEVEPDLVLELVSAANYLDNQDLINLGCNYIGDLLKGKSVEEIRNIFKLQMDEKG
jgi:S-phase kinase-associated protein 1